MHPTSSATSLIIIGFGWSSRREELRLAAHDGHQDGLLALLDVLHELNGGGIALAHVVPNLFGAPFSDRAFCVLRIEPELRPHLHRFIWMSIVTVREETSGSTTRAPEPEYRKPAAVEVMDRVNGDFDMLPSAAPTTGRSPCTAASRAPHLAGHDLPGDAAPPLTLWICNSMHSCKLRRPHRP